MKIDRAFILILGFIILSNIFAEVHITWETIDGVEDPLIPVDSEYAYLEGSQWVSLNSYSNGQKIVCDSQNRVHIVYMYNFSHHVNNKFNTHSEIRYCRVDNTSPPTIMEGYPEIIWGGDEGTVALNPVIGYGKVNFLFGSKEYIFFAWEGCDGISMDTVDDTDIYFKWLCIDKTHVPPTETWSGVYKISENDSYQGAPCIDVPTNQPMGGPIKVNLAWEDFRHGELINNGEIYYIPLYINGTEMEIGMEERVSYSDQNTIRPNVVEDDSNNIHFAYSDLRTGIDAGYGITSYVWKSVYRQKLAGGGWTGEEVLLIEWDDSTEDGLKYKVFRPNMSYISPTKGLFMVTNCSGKFGNKNTGKVRKYSPLTGSWSTDDITFMSPIGNDFKGIYDGFMTYGMPSLQISYNSVDEYLYFTGNTNSRNNTEYGVFWGVIDPDEFPPSGSNIYDDFWVTPSFHESTSEDWISDSGSTIDNDGCIHVVWTEKEFSSPVKWSIHYTKGTPDTLALSKESEKLTDKSEKEELLSKSEDEILFERESIPFIRESKNAPVDKNSTPQLLSKEGYHQDKTLLESQTYDTTEDLTDETEAMARVYPNPCDEGFTVLMGDSISNNNEMTISLYDLTGRLVSRQKLSGDDKTSFETSELLEGIYFISIENDADKEVRKILVIH